MATETDLPLQMPDGETLAITGDGMTTETYLPLQMPDGETLRIAGIDDLLVGNIADVIGRMSLGLDPTEFEVLPPLEVDITPEQLATQPDLFAGQDKPAPFASLSPAADAQYPALSRALRKTKEEQDGVKLVRLDTDATHGEFVAEAAIRELSRRIDEVKDALAVHLAEHEREMHPGYRGAGVDVLGAARVVQKLSGAKTVAAAVDALPQVPVDVPLGAEGKVKCWRDGDAIVCQMRFQAADGSARTATMAGRPKADAQEVLGWARGAGVSPLSILGVVPRLAEAACAKKLVQDVAGACLGAQRRLDVLGMEDKPLVLLSDEDAADAGLAAVMQVEQQAQAGDAQSSREMDALEIAAPSLTREARHRLRTRRPRADREAYAARHADMALCLG